MRGSRMWDTPCNCPRQLLVKTPYVLRSSKEDNNRITYRISIILCIHYSMIHAELKEQSACVLLVRTNLAQADGSVTSAPTCAPMARSTSATCSQIHHVFVLLSHSGELLHLTAGPPALRLAAALHATAISAWVYVSFRACVWRLADLGVQKNLNYGLLLCDYYLGPSIRNYHIN